MLMINVWDNENNRKKKHGKKNKDIKVEGEWKQKWKS